MKKIAILICILILARPIVPVVSYAINYDYISRVLCQSKLKPELGCHGKCYLMKKLADQAENDKPASQDKKTYPSEIEFVWTDDGNLIPLMIASPFIRPICSDMHQKPIDAWQSGPFKPPII